MGVRVCVLTECFPNKFGCNVVNPANDIWEDSLTDVGDVLLLNVLLFSFGERLGRGEGSCLSGGVPSLGVEVLGGDGDNHQNSPPLPLSK